MAVEFRRIIMPNKTTLEWLSVNPVLAAGEFGVESDTGRFKIGNGNLAWVDLKYSAPGTDGIDDQTPAELRVSLGLDNVNNTLDINKPVSVPQAAAIAQEASIRAASDAALGKRSVSVGTTSADLDTASHTSAYGFAVTAPGSLTGVSVNLTAPTIGEIHHYRMVGSVYKVLRIIQIAQLPAGISAISFTAFDVVKGDFVGYIAKTGGFVRGLNSGPLGQIFTLAPSAVGETTPAPSGARPSVLITVTRLASLDVPAYGLADVNTAIRNTAYNPAATGLTVGSTDFNLAFTSDRRGFGQVMPKAGLARSISFNLSAAGTYFVQHLRKNASGTLELIYQSPDQEAITDGVTTLAINRLVAANDVLIVVTKSGGYMRFASSPNGASGVFIVAVPTNLGDTGTTGLTRPSVSVDLASSLIETLTADVSGLQAVNSQSTGPVQIDQTFAAPANVSGWTLAGSWVVSNGLKSPATGGWGTYALSQYESSVWARKITSQIKVTTATSKFGVCCYPPVNSGGAAVLVDGAAGTLSIYRWTGTADGSNVTTVPLTAALVAGRNYTIEIEKAGLFSQTTLTDCVTHQTTTLVSPDRAAGFRQWHGRVGAMFHNGDVTFNYLTVEATTKKSPRIVLVGDSNAEGNHLPSNSKTWAAQIYDLRAVQRDVFVAARAGDTTTTFIARRELDLLRWRPRYVILALGTNDINAVAAWRTNTAANIALVKGIGAEPILCTMLPRTASTAHQADMAAMNADIRANYFGRVRYIDLAHAVSLNHDGVTWDPAYDFGDQIHANQAGQDEMFKQALADCPFLVNN